MKINEIMHKGAEHVTPDTPITTLAKKMLDDDIGAIPVYQDGRMIGIVTDRDITLRVVANGADPSKLTVADVMTSGVDCCHDIDDVDDAVQLMESKHIRRLPVLDESNRLVGMVSLGDISNAMPRDITGELMQSVSAHHA